MNDGAHALTEADAAAVREVFETVVAAQNSGDWDTVQRNLTADHIGLDPRVEGPIRGVDAWREFVDSFALGDVDLDFTIEDLSGDGDVAYVLWTSRGSWTERGEEVSTSGKGITLLRRDADGFWRFSRYCWNANP